MAFPDPILGSNVSSTEGLDTGLTKREYFAAMALQGIMSDPNREHNAKSIPYSELAVRMADYLIEALNREADND